MKLYYSPGACSTSCHITLEESGLKYDAIKVDWNKTSDPTTTLVKKLNPLETLPILITDDGKQLDQNLAIHTYVADKAASKGLLPPAGTYERAEALNWLSFVAADLHKAMGGLFSLESISPDKGVQESVRKYMLNKTHEYLGYMNSKLAGKDYLLGKSFSPADSYAFVVTGWSRWLEVPLDSYPNVKSYMARVGSRPAVTKVLKEEELT